MVDSTTPDAEQ